MPRLGGSNLLYYDLPLLLRCGFLTKRPRKAPLDSYPIARLNDENRGNGLKDLGKEHFHVVNHTPYWGDGEAEAWHSRWREWPQMTQSEREERIRYSGLDAWLGIQVLQKEVERLKRKPHLVRAYTGIVLPQAQAIEEMNAEGLPLDIEAAEARSEELEAKKIILTAGLQALVPGDARPKKKVTRSKNKTPVITEEPIEDINFASYKQLKQMLFEKAGLPTLKRTKITGGEASDEEVLLKLLDLGSVGTYPSWAFEVIRGTLQIRKAVKERGYVESLLESARMSHDGRVHSTFKIGPVTWRLASEEPNVQQLSGPVKQLFRAPDGWKFCRHDHQALEVRGLADQSGDPVLIGRIRRGMDLHWVHAAGFLGWGYDDTLPTAKEGDNKKIRFAFKTNFFASGYGISAKMLAVTMRKEFHNAGIGTDIVLRILSERGIASGEDPYVTLATEWLKWLRKEYKVLRASFFRYGAPDDEGENPDKYPVWRDRLVRSKLGFERRVPEIRDYDNEFVSEAHRQAYNFPSQNLSALTFLSYRDLRQRREDMGLDTDARLCLQEHDSTMWLVREDMADFWETQVRDAMEDVSVFKEFGSEFAVPLKVEGAITEIWE